MEKPSTTLIEEKLNNILDTLERLDRRDRWRTIGGFIKGALGLVPLGIFLWFLWYGVTYSDQLLQKLISMTAQEVNKSTQQNISTATRELKGIDLRNIDLNKLLNP